MTNKLEPEDIGAHRAYLNARNAVAEADTSGRDEARFNAGMVTALITLLEYRLPADALTYVTTAIKHVLGD